MVHRDKLFGEYISPPFLAPLQDNQINRTLQQPETPAFCQRHPFPVKRAIRESCAYPWTLCKCNHSSVRGFSTAPSSFRWHLSSGERREKKQLLLGDAWTTSRFIPIVKLIGGSGISIICHPVSIRLRPLIRLSHTPIWRSVSVPVQLWLVEPMMLENEARVLKTCAAAVSLIPPKWWSFCSASNINELK